MDSCETLDIQHLEAYSLNSQGKYVLTRPDIHITYVGHPASLESLISDLRKLIGEKGCMITEFSAAQDTLICGPVTHVALRLVNCYGGRVRICGKDPFAAREILDIRLIKKPQQWDWVFNVYHKGMTHILQRTLMVAVPRPGTQNQLTALQTAPPDLPPKARGDVERYTRAKNAFDRFCKTNTAFVRDILLVATNEGRGKGHWYSYFDDVSEITDYLLMTEQAVVFHNCWSPGHIISELQKVCNSGVRPASVILCYLTPRPPDDVVVKIHQLCDQISSGTVLSPGYRQTDVPLSTWKPHVFVFANFCPEVDSGFDNGHWGLSLPSQMNYTSHLIVPRDYVDTLVEAAKRHLRPSLEVVNVSEFLESLRDMFRDFEVRPEDLPGRFKSVQTAAAALFEFFTPHVRLAFLRAGFSPVFTLMKTLKFGSGGRQVPELKIVGEVVQITQMTMPTSIIGKTGKIGNVYVRSIPLTDEERELFAEKIQSLVGMAPLPSPNMIEDMARNKGLPVPPAVPLILDDILAPKAVLFDELTGPFPEMGPTVEFKVHRKLDDFLRGCGATWGVKTPTPMGEVVSKGWMIEKCRAVVKVDFGLPPKGEAYQMLYWFEYGYRIIRMRADDVGVDWAGGMECTVELEHALRNQSLGDFVYLDRVSGRDSWRELRVIVSRLSARLMCHNAWWEEFIGPIVVDEPESGEDSSRSSPPASASISSPVFPATVAAEAPSQISTSDQHLSPAAPSDTTPPISASDQQPVPAIPSDTALPISTSDHQPALATLSDTTPLISASDQLPSPPKTAAPLSVSDHHLAPATPSISASAPSIRWAIYCRSSVPESLPGQRNYSLAHAISAGLSPIAGPRVYFEDLCDADTHPNNRPGLQAFLKSGATGMLCANGSVLAPARDLAAAIVFLGSRGVTFRTID
jgi:hypothetical protein